MSLTQVLAEAKQKFIAHTPIQIQTEMFRQIREQQESGIAYGRHEGQKAKDFTLKNALGESLNLYDELSKGPVVLTFTGADGARSATVSLRPIRSSCRTLKPLGAS